jgi:hypothetical protein
MASERDEAIKAVLPGSTDQDESLIGVLSEAESEAEKTKRLKISNDHEVNMRRAELGWFGRLFGGEAHAPVVIAFMVVILGFFTAI